MMIILITDLVILVAPLAGVVVFRLVKLPMISRSRHYLYFLGLGLIHGYLIWFAFLYSEWRESHTWLDALSSLPRGGLRMSSFFVLAYFLVALVIDLVSRLSSDRESG